MRTWGGLCVSGGSVIAAFATLAGVAGAAPSLTVGPGAFEVIEPGEAFGDVIIADGFVSLAGGSVETLSAEGRSIATIEGGAVNGFVRATDGSLVTIRGGDVALVGALGAADVVIEAAAFSYDADGDGVSDDAFGFGGAAAVVLDGSSGAFSAESVFGLPILEIGGLTARFADGTETVLDFQAAGDVSELPIGALPEGWPWTGSLTLLLTDPGQALLPTPGTTALLAATGALVTGRRRGGRG